jgi:hypothetical protein
MNVGRMLVLAVGLIVGLAGVALATAGSGLLWAQMTHRDASGYFASPPLALQTDGYAVTAERIDITGTAPPSGWVPDIGELAARVSVAPAGEGSEVFVGVAAEDDLDRYLRDVAHVEVAGVDGPQSEVTYRTHAGAARPAPPGEQDFWVASAQGGGRQTLEWEMSDGRWAVVVMNGDASPDVTVTADAGVRVAHLTAVAVALLASGLLLVGGGAALLVAATRATASRPAVSRHHHVTSP